MRLRYTSAFVAIALVGGCVSQAQTTPEYGESYAGLSTGPGNETYDDSSWSGPPGGAMDPGYGYADPSYAQSPSAQSADPNAPGVYGGTMYGGQTYGDAWADPTAPAADPDAAGTWTGATAEVTDAEIDVTLDAYGEWVEDADYGRVWRPYTTVVGAEFTPYESCGDWVFTDYGWTFQSCDAWNWGWLAFHFGRWVYLDNSWCWSRDYTWGPGWVDWRHGGGYVGWRPMSPTRQIRDHRDRNTGPLIRDHRRGKHEDWRFTSADGFGRRPLRSSPTIGVREGLRATTSVAQPPIRGDHRQRASSVMAGRLRDHQRFDARTRGQIGQSTRGYQQTQPTRGYNMGGHNMGGYTNGRANPRTYNPTYNPTVVAPSPNRPTWQSNRNYHYNPPATNNGYRNPNATNNGYRNPNATNNGYRAPTNSYNPPTRGSYNPPTRGSYNPPARGSYNPPSRSGSSWGGSRGSAPSPSSRPSSNWGGSRSSSPSPSRGSYSAPSRSYSAPSHSSSSSGSHSSGGSRGSSSSGGSHSSGGGSHGGGGRHR